MVMNRSRVVNYSRPDDLDRHMSAFAQLAGLFTRKWKHQTLSNWRRAEDDRTTRQCQ